ncbi:hypothetical protein A2U01_0078738, partial [Trifolium medium]|nr:hypothetical protein [Trifolium medium]
MDLPVVWDRGEVGEERRDSKERVDDKAAVWKKRFGSVIWGK